MRCLGLSLLLLTLVSCGESPLLNHSRLSDKPARLVGLQTGLSFAKLNAPFSITWSAGCPNLTDGCVLDVSFADPLPSNSVMEAKLYMPDMGHGSSPVTVTELGPSAWQFSDAYFIMPGLWQVILKLTLIDGSHDEVILTYIL